MRARPGDGLLHPIALLAIAALVINDHVLKRAMPGFVTGKLSDVAGMIFFPLFLQAIYELTVGRREVPSRRVLLIAIASTAAVFAATKTLPFANEWYRHGLAMLQWPVRASLGARTMRPVMLVRDWTDLIAIPASALGMLVHRHRCAVGEAHLARATTEEQAHSRSRSSAIGRSRISCRERGTLDPRQSDTLGQ